MDTPEKPSRRPKAGVRQVLELHKALNPDRGLPLLIAIDQATGQLFFCASRGSCLARDRHALTSGEANLYEQWRQTRQSR